MFTLGYSFKPWEAAKAIADGPDILSYVQEAAREYDVEREIRFGHKVVSARVVVGGRALDRRGRARRRDRHAHRRLPLLLLGLLPLRRGLHARVRGHRALRRADRAPPALARGPRLRGQAGGGDRQRRHRRHADPRDGAGHRAHHDAPALAQLRAGAARARPGRRPACARCCRRRPPTRRSGGRTCCSPSAPTSSAGAAEVRAQAAAQARADAAAQGLRRRHPLQPALRPVGPAHVHRARRRPVQEHQARRRLGRHRPDRDLHRERASSSRRARSSRRTSSSRPPA